MKGGRGRVAHSEEVNSEATRTASDRACRASLLEEGGANNGNPQRDRKAHGAVPVHRGAQQRDSVTKEGCLMDAEQERAV